VMVEAMIEALWQGPPAAGVVDVAVEEVDPPALPPEFRITV